MLLKNLGNTGFKNGLIQGSNDVASRYLSTLLPLAVSFIHSPGPLTVLRWLEQRLSIKARERKGVFLFPEVPAKVSLNLMDCVLISELIPVVKELRCANYLISQGLPLSLSVQHWQKVGEELSCSKGNSSNISKYWCWPINQFLLYVSSPAGFNPDKQDTNQNFSKGLVAICICCVLNPNLNVKSTVKS